MCATWRLSRVLQAHELCSCVQTADGLRVVEVPAEHHRDELLIPVVHVKVDQGSVGWPLSQWLIYIGKVRGTSGQRGPNDAKATLLTNGLWLSVVPWTSIMNVFAGPWNSAAFHQYVRQACEDFAHRPEFQDITRLLYDGTVREDDYDGDDIRTAAHLEVVHKQLATCALVCRKRLRVRLLRWYAFFRRARAVLRPRHKLAAVLLCVVDLRGWWRGLLETSSLCSPSQTRGIFTIFWTF